MSFGSNINCRYDFGLVILIGWFCQLNEIVKVKSLVAWALLNQSVTRNIMIGFYTNQNTRDWVKLLKHKPKKERTRTGSLWRRDGVDGVDHVNQEANQVFNRAPELPLCQFPVFVISKRNYIRPRHKYIIESQLE